MHANCLVQREEPVNNICERQNKGIECAISMHRRKVYLPAWRLLATEASGLPSPQVRSHGRQSVGMAHWCVMSLLCNPQRVRTWESMGRDSWKLGERRRGCTFVQCIEHIAQEYANCPECPSGWSTEFPFTYYYPCKHHSLKKGNSQMTESVQDIPAAPTQFQ